MRHITILCLAVCAFHVFAEDSLEKDYADELPRFPPVEPAEALATFEVMDGYKLELVAHEPLVMDPVAAAFDEYGRMFVVEMRGYSERREANDGGVVLLTDTDGDGLFDKRDQYVDNLAWPTAVACWDGGIFVGVAPDILYCKDTDGDGVADVREVAFTGFGTSNVQGLLNSFQWTLDNRIHGATSSSGGLVRRPDQPESETQNLNGRDFSFDPRTREMRPESGGGQHGLTFDDWGRKYVCSNSDHIQQVMYEDRYLARAPWLAAPSPRVSIAADGPQAEVFRISPPEPWRVVRTRLRVSGIVSGPIEGGGRPAGYFTGATGTTIYRGNLMPELRGMAFVADIGGNLVHRKRLESVDGIEMRAVRIDEGREFVASRDTWFRPAQFVNGPEGALYILDVYREIIEHPASLPPVIKKHLDLNSGNDRGRIYRVVPAEWKYEPPRNLSALHTDELVAELSASTAAVSNWRTETAARLLVERNDKESLALLRQRNNDIVHVEGLYAISSLGEVEEQDISGTLLAATPEEGAFSDLETESREHFSRIRMHTIALSERLPGNDGVAALLLDLSSRQDPRVLYQLALSAGELNDPFRSDLIAAVLRTSEPNKWIHFALRTSLGAEPVPVLMSLLDRNGDDEKLIDFVAETAVAASGTGIDALTEILEAVRSAAPESANTLQSRISRMLIQQARIGDARALMGGEIALSDALENARRAALDPSGDMDHRRASIELLALDSFSELESTLYKLLEPAQPVEIQSSALRLAQLSAGEKAPELLISVYPALAPTNATRVIEILFSRPQWLLALLEAVEHKRVPKTALSATRIDAARNHGNDEVRKKAIALFAQGAGRRENLDELTAEVHALQGDATRGATIFAENCAQCHKYRDIGHEVGPDLAASISAGADKLITNILDPNLEVDPRYNNYIIDTMDFESHSGIIAAETANSITLKRANGDNNTVLRENIETMRNSELSIMPENWDEVIGLQGIADVVAFLSGG